MMKRLTEISSHFLLELNISILFLFLFYINKQELPPILLLAVLCFSSILLFIIILEKYRNKGKRLFFVTIFPLLIVAGYLAGLSIFVGFVLAMLVFWRGQSLYEDASQQSEIFLLLLSFLVGILAIVYSGMSHYPYQNQIIILLIIQVLLVIIGSFVKKWNTMITDKSKFAIYLIKILAAIAVIGVTVTFLLIYIQLLFFTILKLFVLVFSSIIGPILNLLNLLLSRNESKERKLPPLEESDVLQEADKYQRHSYGITDDILYSILFAGIVVSILYLIYKRHLRQKKESDSSSPLVKIFEGSFKSNQVSFSQKKGKPPVDLIRREIFDLENYAQKRKLGRLPYETLSEWWQRVGITDSEELIEYYNKVRYGGVIYSKEETTQISKEIRQLRQRLKDIYKNKPNKNMLL
ncbi:hypothetical protein KW850_01430 [Bacillus sp. sid0103]|uniref:hypothetical protein n=1 Tax=Bacillus sp. sid0103 TaxID=2856337 RepID=UPI001C47BA61|nr:hypothetical protein [Bacillus sp. sid0103]MBV7503928.1 hypothetical protein [Bacillus sp. sid0103]